jgi:CRP-like cAMP-binding protein
MESVLDLRTTPQWDRHGLACAAFSDLHDNDTLRLLYDYEPRPLRRRFETAFSHQVVWVQRRLARGHWEISLRKLAAPSDARSITHFMQRCAIFSQCSESTSRALASVADVRTIKCGTTIAEQEADWPFVGLVRRGTVFAIVGSPRGRDQILYESLETDVFGNVDLFDSGATIARFATLADPAEIVLFSRAEVLRAAEADSRFALALAAASTQQCRTMAELVSAHVSKKIVARVASALRRYAPVESGLTMVDPVNLPSLRLRQIAAATGTLKEVVARAVAELEGAGAIRRVRGRIALIDRGKLAAFD